MAKPMAEDGPRNLRVVEEPEPGSTDLVGEYLKTLGGRSAATVEVYGRILRQLSTWVAESALGVQMAFAPSY